MAYTSKQLTAQLLELRKAIKRKYKAFKEGVEESDIMLEKQYKPIIKELRRKSTVPNIKKEPKEEEEEEEESMDYEPIEGEEEEYFEPPAVSTPRRHDLTELVSTPSQLASTTQFIDKYFKNPITKEYMSTFLRDGSRKKLIDYTYGPRYVDGDTLMIGNKELDFDDKGNIIIDGVKYGASEGLYELLFKRVPDQTIYTAKDLQTYKSILFATNAHRENHSPGGKILSNKSIKYTRIVKPLFRPTTKGKGMVWKNTNSRDIIHWDDANELIERLQHIVMSTETGNRVHSNEIISIMEELREAGFIKGSGNSRFKALLK